MPSKKTIALKKNSPARLLVLMISYSAEKTIESVLQRIPVELNIYQTDVLVLDDASPDNTEKMANAFKEANPDYPFPLTVLSNPVNQNIGGNIKIGFYYAIKNEYDIVCLIHGDGQYAPEELPRLVAPIASGEADTVFGSRMMEGFCALRGGMPFYKFVGNKILTWIENKMLGSNLSEFHTGLRLYSVNLLKRIPFQHNSNDFHFETEIIFQVHYAGCRFREFPIPTFYGDEISHVNGFKYAWNTVVQAALGRAQELGLCYQRKFDLSEKNHKDNYLIPNKSVLNNTHHSALKRVADGTRVLDFGSAAGLVGELLRKRGCKVTGIDVAPPEQDGVLDEFITADLNDRSFKIDLTDVDLILLFDIVNHLHKPERFLERLHQSTHSNPKIRLLVTTGNIGFFVNRLQLLFGFFNYGKRGILAPSHTRLLTFASSKRLFEEAGFQVIDVDAAPAPYQFAFGDNWFSRLLTTVNKMLIHINKNFFGYGIILELKPAPTLSHLLEVAEGVANADGLDHDPYGPRRKEQASRGDKK